MDNITHTLIGLAIGEAALQIVARSNTDPEAVKQTLNNSRLRFWTVSAIGNNFPDLDFLYANQFVAGGGTIGYLLHHRGHTHTFLLAFPQSAAILLGLWYHVKRSAQVLRKIEWKWLTLLAITGPYFHILADAFNNYGVHPFWPLDNRWYYGDSIFIVEPWLWIVLSPHLFHRSKSLVAKGLFLTFPLIAIGFLFLRNHIPYVFGLLGSTYTIMMLLAPRFPNRFNSSKLLNFYSILMTSVIVITFSTASNMVRKKLTLMLQSKDISLAPSPGNPFCWNVLSMTTDSNRNYLLKKGSYSLLPNLVSHKDCGFRMISNDSTVDNALNNDQTGPYWYNQYSGTLNEMNDLYERSCEFHAFMGFARFPIWVQQPNSQTPSTSITMNSKNVSAADFRFAGSPNEGFSNIQAKSDENHCDFLNAPWIPPRNEEISK